MKTLRPGPPSRGPFVPSPLSASAAVLAADDDADAWWAQQSLNVAVRASAAAGLALASSLCAGLQQQADEVVPWLPSEVNSYGPIAQRAQHATTFKRWEAVDDLPLVTATLEDEVVPLAVARAPSVAVLPWQAEDELPSTLVALEDGEWVAPAPAPRALPPQLWQAEDERPPTPTPDDGYWWRSEAAAVAALSSPVPADDGALPAASVPPEDAYHWRAELPAAALQRMPVLVDDEVPQAPATLQVEDVSWAAELPVAPAALRWSLPAVDELVAPVPALDDGYWESPLPLPASWAKVTWVDGDVAVQALAPQVEDVYWLALTSAPQRPYANYLVASGELVPSTSVLESLARTYAVRTEQRGYVVAAEHRQALTSAEQRKLTIDPQQRSTP